MRRCASLFGTLFVVIITILQPFVHAQIGRVDNSYAFLNVRSRHTPSNGVQFCVNFQQYDTLALPTALADASPLRLAWWNDSVGETDVCRANNRKFVADQLVPALYRTNVNAFLLSECNITSKLNNHLMYWQCLLMSKRNVTQALWLLHRGEANDYGLHDYLFSRFSNPQVQNVPPMSFYMYRDAFFKDVLPYIYGKELGSDLTSQLSTAPTDSNVAELRFYRPVRSLPMDAVVFVIAALAIFSVLLGSVWAAYDTWAELNVVNSKTRFCDESVEEAPRSSSNRQNEGTERGNANSTASDQSIEISGALHNRRMSAGGVNESSFDTVEVGSSQRKSSPRKRNEQRKTDAAVALATMNWASHCCSALCLVSFLTVTIMLAYYFRRYAVYFFDVFVFILGVMSVYKVVYTLIQVVFSRNRAQGSHDFDVELFSLGQIFCRGVPPVNQRGIMSRLRSTCVCTKPIRLLSLVVFCGSTTFCSIWLYMWLNEHPYAFLMLDFMNACFCITAIRDSTCRSMRLITFLLATLFFYDLFMVFGSKLVTSDGCSIMVQVVTGVDCVKSPVNSSANSIETFPIAPIDQNIPKKIPIAFYVPYLSDPMGVCHDLEVERGFQFMILGLGDVILPGFLVAYAFYVDIAKRHRFYSFGLITWLGYVLGLVLTQIALYIMQMGQPALIYLVPCTILPFLMWAWYNGLLREVWDGGDLTRSPQLIRTSLEEAGL